MIIRNYVQLLIGLGLGQGAIFLSTTYLYAFGYIKLVADFGVANAYLGVIQFIVDWGCGTYLASVIAVRKPDSPNTVLYCYFSASAMRFVICAVAIVTIFYLNGSTATFVSNFLLMSSPSMVATALSPVAVLDAQGRSGMAGLLSAVPPATCGVALPLVTALQPEQAGNILGIAYSLASIAMTTLQIWIAGLCTKQTLRAPGTIDILNDFRKATSFALTPLAGHIFFRGQVFLANECLDVENLAAFLYTRLLIGVGYQLVGFALRADLPSTALRLAQEPNIPPVKLAASSWSSLLAIVISACFAAGATQVPGMLGEALIRYSGAVTTLGISSNLQRIHLLQGSRLPVLVIQYASVGICYVFIRHWISVVGISALIVGEIASHLIQLTALAVMLAKRANGSA